MNFFKDWYDRASEYMVTTLVLFGIVEPRDAEHKERTDKAESSMQVWAGKIMFFAILKIAIASTVFVLFE